MHLASFQKLVEVRGIAEQKQSGELFLPKSVAVVSLQEATAHRASVTTGLTEAQLWRAL
jgi:hypothetical protein